MNIFLKFLFTLTIFFHFNIFCFNEEEAVHDLLKLQLIGFVSDWDYIMATININHQNKPAEVAVLAKNVQDLYDVEIGKLPELLNREIKSLREKMGENCKQPIRSSKLKKIEEKQREKQKIQAEELERQQKLDLILVDASKTYNTFDSTPDNTPERQEKFFSMLKEFSNNSQLPNSISSQAKRIDALREYLVKAASISNKIQIFCDRILQLQNNFIEMVEDSSNYKKNIEFLRLSVVTELQTYQQILLESEEQYNSLQSSQVQEPIFVKFVSYLYPLLKQNSILIQHLIKSIHNILEIHNSIPVSSQEYNHDIEMMEFTNVLQARPVPILEKPIVKSEGHQIIVEESFEKQEEPESSGAKESSDETDKSWQDYVKEAENAIAAAKDETEKKEQNKKLKQKLLLKQASLALRREFLNDILALTPTETKGFYAYFSLYGGDYHDKMRAFQCAQGNRLTSKDIDDLADFIADPDKGLLIAYMRSLQDINNEPRYTEQAIQVFAKEFLENHWATLHFYHNQGTDLLPAHWVNHRRMPWIWMGIIEVEAGSKSTNIAHSNLRSRLMERNRRNRIQDTHTALNEAGQKGPSQLDKQGQAEKLKPSNSKGGGKKTGHKKKKKR